jgi:serine/threonine-protein kinase
VNAPQNPVSPALVTPQKEFLNTGERIGRYEIIRMIGRGGMGAVYEATDTQLHRHVAFKTLVGQLVGRPEAIRRFFLEAQAAGRLMHPNVVAIFDFNAEGDFPFMAMELLQGEPLSVAIRKGPMSTKRVADALLGVCAGIESAHKAGIIHRDLKPSNIFLAVDWNGQPRPRVLDFGISKIRDISSGGLTQTGDIIGTSQYLSPEHASANRQVDARSDLYSLGVVIYEAVTQRTPHQDEPVYQLLKNVIEGRWQPPHVYRPDLLPAFEAIILRAMQLRPEDRFPSAFEMGRALFPFASSRVKRQFDEYYNGAGSLSLPGPEGKIATGGAAKEVDLRAIPTEVLPQEEVPNWQKMATHTALPEAAADPNSISKELLFPTDSNASSPAIYSRPVRRWHGWALVGGLIIAIGFAALWRGTKKKSTDIQIAPEFKAPHLIPTTVTPAPSAHSPPALPATVAPGALALEPQAIPVPESGTSPPPPALRLMSTTKPGFTARRRGKFPPTLEEPPPSPPTRPALPPQPPTTQPCQLPLEPNKTSIAPASSESSIDKSLPSPDRW